MNNLQMNDLQNQGLRDSAQRQGQYHLNHGIFCNPLGSAFGSELGQLSQAAGRAAAGLYDSRSELRKDLEDYLKDWRD